LAVCYWFGRIIFFRLKKPSIEIKENKIIVQTKFGNFVDVKPFESYEVVYSNEFFAFRKDSQNDITVELGHIRKTDFPDLKGELSKLPFINYQNDSRS